MSTAALSTTVLSAAALINHAIKSLNERRGLQGYCAERRGLNILMIFLYAAPRLSKLLWWAPRRSLVYIKFIYTQRRGSHPERRGVRTNIHNIIDLLIWSIWVNLTRIFMQLTFLLKSTIKGD